MVCERRVQIGHKTKTTDRQQHAQNSRQEGGPENEVAGQDAPESEEHQVYVESVSIQFEKDKRQPLQLFRRKCAHGATALQDEQRSEVQEAGKPEWRMPRDRRTLRVKRGSCSQD